MRIGSTTMVFTALVATLAAACGGESKSSSPAPAAPVTNPVDPATAGAVIGKVTFMGTPPKAETISMSSDPRCMNAGAKTESVMVSGDGSLQNVFVYVKDGLGNLKFPVPTSALVLDQKGCQYRPHVFGVQAGQPIEILNSDMTLHNIHAWPQTNQEFNMGQSLQGMKDTHVFTTPEIMVPFRCDVHRWMNSFVGVVAHPFFAVTGADGAFELKGLPPGTYTLEAWHEKFGTKTASVTIGAKESKDVAFTFSG
ncbi:MAG TPA: carboxypeptidase regulatory-like domain-containing protein [Vicinamibacterales bacterium]|jgi:plastocyanin|nr:carboxypeptidase regulatory-like domain-containing protein [Vicinamibacterales bacterium]